MITEKISEIIFVLFLCIVSTWVIVEGYILSLDELHDIGPGFLLFFEATFMGILSLASLIKVSRSHMKAMPAFSSYHRLGRVCWTILITFITALFFETLGFILMTAIYMVLLLRFVGQERWIRLSLVTILTIILSYIIFNFLLGMQLPTGPLGF
jgi:hypothetical protein